MKISSTAKVHTATAHIIAVFVFLVNEQCVTVERGLVDNNGATVHSGSPKYSINGRQVSKDPISVALHGVAERTLNITLLNPSC